MFNITCSMQAIADHASTEALDIIIVAIAIAQYIFIFNF